MNQKSNQPWQFIHPIIKYFLKKYPEVISAFTEQEVLKACHIITDL